MLIGPKCTLVNVICKLKQKKKKNQSFLSFLLFYIFVYFLSNIYFEDCDIDLLTVDNLLYTYITYILPRKLLLNFYQFGSLTFYLLSRYVVSLKRGLIVH